MKTQIEASMKQTIVHGELDVDNSVPPVWRAFRTERQRNLEY